MVSICQICIDYLYIIGATDGAEIIEPIGGEAVYIVVGNNVTLRCVGVGYPPPLIEWRKLNGSLSDRVSVTNMSMLTNEGNVTNVTVDLIFTGAYREDTGVYDCSVSNLLNTISRNSTLIIQCALYCLITTYALTCKIIVKKATVDTPFDVSVKLCIN